MNPAEQVHEQNNNRSTELQEAGKDIEELPLERVKSMLEDLKRLPVNSANMKTIEELLVHTFKYRQQLVADLQINLIDQFPFFHTNPELVMY